MDDLQAFSREQNTKDALRRALGQLAKAKARTEDLVEAVYQGARDAYLALPAASASVPKPDKRTKGVEVALWHLSDWQGAKVTSSYDSSVMRERVQTFCQRAADITDIQRSDHPVKECYILFGGDMIEGLFNFPTQPFEIDATLFGQWVNVSQLIIDTVQAALGIYEKVTVIGEWGNHGRIGNKRAVVPRADNVDRMCYEHARQMLAGEKRLSWQDCPEDIQRVEIGNYRALLIHGDEIGRNGFASRATITKHVIGWQSGAYPWAFRDCYVGHYHVHGEESLANGEGAVYWTGSTESDNRYAREQLASSAKPSQRLHFINPRAGHVTATYKIYL